MLDIAPEPTVTETPEPVASQPQRRVRRVLCLVREVRRSHGWGRVAFELFRELQDAGVALAVFTARGAKNDAFIRPQLYRQLWSTGFGLFKPLRAAADAALLSHEARRADIILACDEPSALAAAYLARQTGKPFACVLHGTFAVSSLKGWRGLLHRPAFDKAGALIFVSEHTKRAFLETFQTDAPAHVALLGVDQRLVDSDPVPFERRERAVLTVGEVKPRKGLMQIVEACALIEPQRRPAILAAGDISAEPTYVEAVRARAHELGVALHVLGRVSHDELEALYKRVRVFALPSQNVDGDFEGFGLVHLEAAARGVPAIGSRDCGNEDAIRDGVTGYLLEQGYTGGLARRIDALTHDKTLWTRFSAESVAFARTMTWGKTRDVVLTALSAAL